MTEELKTIYRCGCCATPYEDKELALKCEQAEIVGPALAIGSTVKYEDESQFFQRWSYRTAEGKVLLSFLIAQQDTVTGKITHDRIYIVDTLNPGVVVEINWVIANGIGKFGSAYNQKFTLGIIDNFKAIKEKYNLPDDPGVVEATEAFNKSENK